MNSRHIIAEAWEFTKENKRLMWWYAFLPSLLSTLVGILYLAYQYYAFKRSPLFENAETSFLVEAGSKIINFLNNFPNLWVPAIVVVIIVGVLYLLLPTLFQGALIQLIARMRKGEQIHPASGIGLGMIVFLPLLEYHLLVKGFSIFSILTEAGFIARNLGLNAFKTLLPILIGVLIIGFIITLLFTYAEFFITLDKKPVLRSIGRSSKLVILSWQHTFLIGILMLIIGLRIIINIVAVLLVPALLIFFAGALFTTTLTTIGVIIGILFALIGLFVASYFGGILNVFANTVWTFTFLQLMDEQHTKELMNE